LIFALSSKDSNLMHMKIKSVLMLQKDQFSLDENSGNNFGRSSRKPSVGSGRRDRSKERSRDAEEDEAERKKRREERAR
jgi:hypothetical protein